MSWDYKLISEHFSELIYTELFTIPVLWGAPIFYRYNLDTAIEAQPRLIGIISDYRAAKQLFLYSSNQLNTSS